MKYQISFDNRHTLTFKVLNTLSARAWIELILLNQSAKHKVFRTAFPSTYNIINYFNELNRHYKKIQKYNIDLGFKLKQDILNYTGSDYLYLDKKVDDLFQTVVFHRIYQRHKEEARIRFHVKRLKKFKEELLDVKYFPKENYTWIKPFPASNEAILVSDEMRQADFVETARPRIVIRACPAVDIRSLNILEKRNDPSRFSNEFNNCMTHITNDYKICFYKNELSSTDAIDLMKNRRWQLVNFAAKNLPGLNPSLSQHYNYVFPIVAHCTNEDDISEPDLFELAKTIEHVTTKIEE